MANVLEKVITLPLLERFLRNVMEYVGSALDPLTDGEAEQLGDELTAKRFDYYAVHDTEQLSEWGVPLPTEERELVATQSAHYGDVFELPEVSLAGCKLYGFNSTRGGSGSPAVDGADICAFANKAKLKSEATTKLYAVFGAKLATVAFDSQGGSDESVHNEAGIAQTNPVGGYVRLALDPAPTRDGYSFGGWYTQPDGGGWHVDAGTEARVVDLLGADAEDGATLTLYAKWEEM